MLPSLARACPVVVPVIECRLFQGLSEVEAARALGLPLCRVLRARQSACHGLAQQLQGMVEAHSSASTLLRMSDSTVQLLSGFSVAVSA